MRDWAAFVHESHLGALEEHLEAQGYADSLELQRLFAAMRANDLIWSSVVNHYLLDRPAPPSDLLYWFEDGARIPAAFLKSYNRELLLDNKLKEPAGFAVGDSPSTLRAIATPMLVIALKDDHVSAWEAVYRRRAPSRRGLRPRRLGPQCRGHQPARREQAWLLDQQASSQPTQRAWLEDRDPARRQLVAVVDQMADGAGQQEDGRGAPAQGPDRAGARPLRDDAVMDCR